MLDDQQLIIKAQQGNRTALNALTTKYWPSVYRFVYYRLNDAEEALEITQETFLKALRALSKYRMTDATFKTYLLKIAQNLITDFWRKQGRSPQVIDITEFWEPIVDPAEVPEEILVKTELRIEIQRLLDTLPEEQRRTVHLRLIKGLSVTETAKIMGKTEAAIKMLQQRGLRNLRKLFIENGIMDN